MGGGSVLYQLLSQRHINRVICSDINLDLINLWNLIKSSPDALIKHYTDLWNKLYYIENTECKKQFYYNIRERFNKYRDPKDFFFLTRTSVNGLIRYNNKKEFNTSLHFSRDGIRPENLREILSDWNKKIQHVEFECHDYKKIQPSKNDFTYLDPPYDGSNSMYYGTIDYNELWNWMRTLKCPYLLSFIGISGVDNRTFNVPKDIYSSHIYVYSGCSSFKRLHSDVKIEYVQESLYIKGCELIEETAGQEMIENLEIL